MSVRQELRDRVILELNQAVPFGVPLTTKRRYIPGEKLRDPRIAAFFAEEETQDVGGGGGVLVRRGLLLALQAIVIVEEPEQADDAIEPLLVHIVAVMGETTLQKKALNVVEVGTLWASANDAGGFILAAMTRWRIDYHTLRNDLTKRQ